MDTALKIHNLTEDIVAKAIEEVCREITASKQKQHICTCDQCRLDAACYVLNRTDPHYIVSSRGVARMARETPERWQKDADITAMIYQAFDNVAHNRRPFFDHKTGGNFHEPSEGHAVFNIPAIVGRLLNGINFEPLSDIDVELRHNGELVAMRDLNWQNPYRLVRSTEGTFTFWPAPIITDTTGKSAAFSFSVRIRTDGFDPLNSFFDIPVVSEIYTDAPFSMDKTFKLRDLYLFPEGTEECTG
jgi:competence protein ComFB